MTMIDTASLNRGATLIEYAFSENGQKFRLSVADMIGLVAAYAATGRFISNLEKDLSEKLGSRIAREARRTLDFFDNHGTSGLWERCPSGGFSFTNPALIEMYPEVNERYKRYIETYGPEIYSG